MSSQDNPLLFESFRIPFHQITAAHVEGGVAAILAEGQRRLDAIADTTESPSWDNLVAPMEQAVQWVGEHLTPPSHLMGVAETPELRDAYNTVLPRISAFWTRLPLDQRLWQRLRDYAETEEAKALTGLRARYLEKSLRSFRRAGADLPDHARERLEALKVDLSQKEQKFAENVLDATAAFELLVTDEARLDGIPNAPRTRFRKAAEAKDLKGWLLTLDYPSVEPVLKYATDRSLRHEIFDAFSSRCRSGEHDNRELILEILRLRRELAELLGYAGFPDYVLEERMAKDGARAMAFETQMVERTRDFWQHDVALLREHAASLGMDGLSPWDVSFVSDSLRKARYDMDDELLRPWFPLDQVMKGMFDIVERVMGLTVTEKTVEEVWHPQVRYYEIHDEAGTWLGAFYTDWFPRKEKRQGAWMNDFISGGPQSDGSFSPHLGVICGNFTPPDGDAPALLNHREVETIFHEFGHLLHHCTSQVKIPSLGGLNVAWDWVELPSQLMENWTWEREALDLFARHHETGEPLPEEYFQRMIAARRFMGGWGQMRQLSLGTVDLLLHAEFADQAADATADDLMTFAREQFLAFSPAPEFADYHVLTSFTHLFAGGYASGYYSYLWSEVLDADVFTRFREEGIFNRETGRAYLESILSRGDSEDPEDLFRAFMGRDPDPEALLDRNLEPLPA